MIVAATLWSASTARALPHPDDPIDPSKRAPISTRDAVKPSATQPTGTGAIGGRRIPTKPAVVSGTPLPTSRATIAVSEPREKRVRKAGVRRPSATITASTQFSAADRPAAIPRMEATQFKKLLTQYRSGRRAAAQWTHPQVKVGDSTVDLADINRFAAPGGTLERQGIPVVPAGGGVPPQGGPATESSETRGAK